MSISSRVIADEAQKLKTQDTVTHRSVSELDATYHILLTATEVCGPEKKSTSLNRIEATGGSLGELTFAQDAACLQHSLESVAKLSSVVPLWMLMVIFNKIFSGIPLFEGSV